MKYISELFLFRWLFGIIDFFNYGQRTDNIISDGGRRDED